MSLPILFKLTLSNMMGGAVGQCTVILKSVKDSSGKTTNLDKKLAPQANGYCDLIIF